MKQKGFLLLFVLVSFSALAQTPFTGPRKAQGDKVRLTPVPLGSSPEAIQAMLDHGHYLYFRPGVYNIGTLKVNGWKSGLLWGAGRLSTSLNGSLVISGSERITIGNFTIGNAAPKGESVISIQGNGQSNLVFLNLLASAGKDGMGLNIKAPGNFMVQGCNFSGNDIGVRIEHPRALLNVFGGNFQSNRIHINQVQGHLDARAFGTQVSRGDADIVIQSPSPLGLHLIEGIRTEGSDGASQDERLLKVPQTAAAVNVMLRANALGSMTHYADYNAAGTLWLLENVNYPGPDDKSSVGVEVKANVAAKVISYGNKYGLSYDAAPGPFVLSQTATVQSLGDLWMLPNQTDYNKSFNEPITQQSMRTAGKTAPRGLRFLTSADSAAVQIPDVASYKLATLPRISNLTELMLNVKAFGAVPNDGKDDREAIQRAMDAAEKGGISEPIYFPAGAYDLSAPLFLDHLAGGGFWGDGFDKTILYSPSGKGVILSDGAGYSTFVDIGFVNKAGAETKTVDFDWVNDQSADKKRGNTGAALQSNMFYRDRFENGGIGMAVGAHRMGDGFMMVDCVFKNNGTRVGSGAAFASEGFNALTNPLVHCLFENVDYAVSNAHGSFNFYGNRLANIHAAALYFNVVVADGFAIVNNEMDASPVPLITTGHSSAKAHILVDGINVKAPATTSVGSSYALGGSVMFLRSSLLGRTITNGGGIGDNSLIVYKTVAANVTTSGRAHAYVVGLNGKPAKAKAGSLIQSILEKIASRKGKGAE